MKRLICWLVGHEKAPCSPRCAGEVCLRCSAHWGKDGQRRGWLCASFYAACLALLLLCASPLLAGQTSAPEPEAVPIAQVAQATEPDSAVGVSTEPSAPAPCDPAVSACWETQNWLGSIVVTSPGVETRVLPVARTQAKLRTRNWLFGGRLDLSGQPGKEPNALDFRTASTAEAHILAVWTPIRVAGGIRAGIAAAVGAALALGNDRPEYMKRTTAGVGPWVSTPKGWGVCAAGQNQQLRGLALTCSWEAYTKAGGHFAQVGAVAIGRRLVPVLGLDGATDPEGRLRSELTYILGTGVAARF